MLPTDYLKLVGCPYAFPSAPPKTFDCWSLVKYVRECEGLPCPLPFDDKEDWCVPGNLMQATARARACWTRLPKPEPFVMAVLEPSHVGIVIGGGVLHALSRNASVVWTTLAAIRRRWPQAEWWTA